MSDKYNERVRAIAEEMAKEAHNRQRRVGSDYWLGLAESTKSRKINSFISAGFKAAEWKGQLNIPNIVQELAFGDYGPGRHGWYCEDAVRFDTPIPFKGALSLWDFPDEILKEHGIHIPGR